MYTELFLHEGEPLAKRRVHLTKAIMLEPMELLKQTLVACSASSLDVARESGVAGSVVRSIRNGSVRDVKSETWGRLMWWLLSTQHPKVWPGLPAYSLADAA